MASFGLLFMVVSSTRLAVFTLALGLASVRITRKVPVQDHKKTRTDLNHHILRRRGDDRFRLPAKLSLQ